MTSLQTALGLAVVLCSFSRATLAQQASASEERRWPLGLRVVESDELPAGSWIAAETHGTYDCEFDVRGEGYDRAYSTIKRKSRK